MARLTDKQMERIASAVAEPRCFKILKDLSAHGEPMQCSPIVERHAVSQATISHQLEELETAGGARGLCIVGSDFARQKIAETPLGRMAQPDDIAPVAVFLASDDAHWADGLS